MSRNLRLSIYYPVVIGLLAIACYFIFGRTVSRAPVYAMPDGLIVFSDFPGLQPGDTLRWPGCVPHEAGDVSSFSVCSVVRDGMAYDVSVPHATLDRMDLLRIFYGPLIIAVFMVFSALWFLENGRDTLIALFFGSAAFMLLLTAYVVVYEDGVLLWTLWGFLVSASFLNLNFRTSGIVLSTRILLAEAVGLIFIVLLVVGGTDSPEFRKRAIDFGWSILWLVLAASVIFNLLGIADPDNDRIDRVKRIVLMGGLLSGVQAPLLLILYAPGPVPPAVYIGLSILFPLSLFYGTYRMYLVPFQFFVTRGIAAAVLTVLFLFIYMGVLYVYSELVPGPGNELRWIANIAFLASLVFFLDPLRSRTTDMVERQFLIPRGEHSESLKRLAAMVSRSSRPRVVVQAMLDEINHTLALQRSFLLTSPDFFFHLDLKGQNVLRMPLTSPLWDALRPSQMVFAPYLNLATGSRREVFEFLFHRKLMMGIGLGEKPGVLSLLLFLIARLPPSLRLRMDRFEQPMAQPPCALLIGYPPGRTKLYLHEIRYLQEAARVMGMTLFNIHALFREVDKRKKVREFQLSGQYQKLTLLRPDEPPDTVDYRFYNRPVLSVTGDYIDFVRLDDERVGIFLGDVSGHGLGTGFLVSAVRAIVRTSLAANHSLESILACLNDFLSDRYSGYEFLTLFAMILHIPDGSVQYVNAAHPGAFLKLPAGGIEKLENTQRLLGILPGSYRVHSHQLRPGERVFLFSDGVTEATNPRDEFFGEQRLSAFIARQGDDPLDEMMDGFLATLGDFRAGQAQMDDTSFFVIEYLPARSLLDFVLRGLGLRR